MQVPYVDIDYQWITDSLIITPGDYRVIVLMKEKEVSM